MAGKLKEFKELYYHRKRLEIENDRLYSALKEIKDLYSPGTKAFKIAKKALEVNQT